MKEMRRLFDSSPDEQSVVVPPRRRELLVETVKLLAALIALAGALVGVSARYPSLSKPWVLNIGIALGVLVLMWFAQPHFIAWLRRIQCRRRDRRFILTNDARLRELLGRFAGFTSSNNTRSLIYILRAACSQNQQAVEQILTGDYLGSWLVSFQQQLTLPTQSIGQFVSQCREFSYLVQAFNTNFAVCAQRRLANGASLAEHNITELEEFREEYNAFLRDMEPWAKGVCDYLESGGIADQPVLWKHAPISYFERVKSFVRTKPSGD